MKLFFILLFLSATCACVQVPVRPEALSSKMVEIEAVVPQNLDILLPTSRLALLFSQPMDRQSITDQSILLVHGSLPTQTDNEISSLYLSISKQKLEQVPLSFSFSQNGKLLLIQPSDALNVGDTYTLLVTENVLSKDRIPLRQERMRIPLKILIMYWLLR